MLLIFGYPAILAGLALGYVGTRRGWPISPILAVGAAVFVALVVYQTTVPDPLQAEREPITTPLWTALALANAGCWALGVGIGTATAWITRRGSVSESPPLR